MAKKNGKDEQEEEMIMVGPGSDESVEDEHDEDEREERSDEDEGEDEEEESGSKKRPAKKKASKKDDDEDEDGDSDEDDERVGHGEDDEEDSEGEKGSKRETRKARRERQKRARQRNETELNFLRQRNDALEREVGEIKRRQTQAEAGSIDQRINQTQSQLKVADQVLARAHEAGTGEDVVEAQNVRDKLRDNLNRLSGIKSEMTRRASEGGDEPPVDSRLVFHAQAWMRKNTWYDPNGQDADSRIVAAIDNRLAQEGYDPRTPEYWEELTARAQRRLPQHFRSRRRDDDDDDADDDADDSRESRRPNGKEKRGSGPRFSVGGRERPLRSNEVYVSPARKQALIDAGVWEDKVLRNRYLKKYAEYDRENRGQRR